MLANWTAREQGDRGTCVGFAVTACREWAVFIETGAPPPKWLSEQFMFWAAKEHDAAYPDDDNTTLSCAATGLAHLGVCEAGEWPYSGIANPGPGLHPITHAGPGSPANPPSSSARINASAYTRPMRTVGFTDRERRTGGIAQRVIDVLADDRLRVVALILPVFEDPTQPGSTNWMHQFAMEYGDVFDPPADPQQQQVVGQHAVCVVAYEEPDRANPQQSWFVIRNSWTDKPWGRVPRPLVHGTSTVTLQPGFGRVSRRYVDRFARSMSFII
jgi:hypothetical protein